MKTKILILLVALSANICSFSQVKSTTGQKHTGFYARSTVGLGGFFLSENANTSTFGNVNFHTRGWGGDLSIQAGYSVAENLQVYGVFGANRKIFDSDLTTTLIRYGAGATYYIMPDNVFLFCDISRARDEIKINSLTGKSDYGIIFNLGFGKEWWVSKDLGIGWAFYYLAGSINNQPFENRTPSISNIGFGLAFSVTYN